MTELLGFSARTLLPTNFRLITRFRRSQTSLDLSLTTIEREYNIMKVFVGLGSNLGDRAANLLRAVRGMLNAGLPVTRLSSIYETAPVGVFEAQPAFLNMVAQIDFADASARTTLSPEQLMARLLRIEYQLGRRRAKPLAARTIDLDLLLYGDQIIISEIVIVPHPRLHLRRFVLVPLAEIAPDFIHPTQKKTVRTLLAECVDDSPVAVWSG